MTELERAVVRRNARLKAWAEYGVPVAAAWGYLSVARPGFRLAFEAYCRAEGCGGCNSGTISEVPAQTVSLERRMELAERYFLRFVLGPDQNCTHLAPLLGPEPPEVSALIPLLLLEDPGLGGAP